MKEGSKGCDKAEKFQFLHPEVCSKSTEGQKCTNKGCRKAHFKYLIDNTEKPAIKDIKNAAKLNKPNFRTTASKGTKLKNTITPILNPPTLPPPPPHSITPSSSTPPHPIPNRLS